MPLIGAGAYPAIGLGECLGTNRVAISAIVDQPVPTLTPLFGSPLPVSESISIEVELKSDHDLVSLLSVSEAICPTMFSTKEE